MIQRWEPEARNRASYGGFVGMSGGPARRFLPQHEHPDLQLTVHFGRRGFVRLIAPLEPHAGAWDEGERVTVLLLSPALLAEAADDLVRRGSCAIRSRDLAPDALVRELARAVLRELDRPAPGPNRRLYFESVGYTLASHVVRRYAETAKAAAPVGFLTGRQLERLSEFIDTALDRGVGVAEMASALGLGPRRFADAFRRTTGATPYQYVVRRRLESAKRLLRGGRLPIVDVALRLGFASQSHFTAAFTRLTGLSPARWRLRG